MRHDIAKLIVERPRTGAGGQLSKQYRREVMWSRLVQEGREEDSPPRESIRRKWGWDRKEFSDYLAPVKGFLRKSVGRPWDDVWSEIDSHLSVASTTQRHVLGHVEDYVEMNAVEQADGSITDYRGYPLSTFRGLSLYVCPSSGILKKGPEQVKFRYKLRVDVPIVRFHRISGIWFEITFSKLPVVGDGWAVGGHIFSSREKLDEWLETAYDFYRGRVREIERHATVRDVLVDRTVDDGRTGDKKAHWLDGGYLYCSAKRQIGKKELLRYKLRSVTEDHGGPEAVVAS